MNDAALKSSTKDIVVDEVFPHAPEIIWKALMTPTGFEPVKGKRFTYQTTPASAWDGVIHCEVLEAVPNQRLVYAWKAGDDSNAGYGSRLDTVVTLSLAKAEGGTRLRLVHAGFVLPKNDTAFTRMGAGWKSCFPRIGAIADEHD